MKLTMEQIDILLEAVGLVDRALSLLEDQPEFSDLADKLDEIIMAADQIGTEVELSD